MVRTSARLSRLLWQKRPTANELSICLLRKSRGSKPIKKVTCSVQIFIKKMGTGISPMLIDEDRKTCDHDFKVNEQIKFSHCSFSLIMNLPENLV